MHRLTVCRIDQEIFNPILAPLPSGARDTTVVISSLVGEQHSRAPPRTVELWPEHDTLNELNSLSDTIWLGGIGSAFQRRQRFNWRGKQPRNAIKHADVPDYRGDFVDPPDASLARASLKPEDNRSALPRGKSERTYAPIFHHHTVQAFCAQSYHFRRRQGNCIRLGGYPSGIILEIGLSLPRGHSVIFLAIQTHLSWTTKSSPSIHRTTARADLRRRSFCSQGLRLIRTTRSQSAFVRSARLQP